MSKKFRKSVTLSGQAEPCDAGTAPAGTVHEATFVPGGAAVDWTSLHQRLNFQRVFAPQLSVLDAKIRSVSSTSLLTSVELTETWEKLPLAPEASDMCVVQCEDGWVKFKRGPPGHRSIAEAFAAMLESVCSQLDAQGVRAIPYVASVVILSETFDEALHRTAAVFKALKAAGLPCHAPGSSFVPRAIVRSEDSAEWSTLDVAGLGDRLVDFVAFAFAVLLHDTHLYGGLRYGSIRRDGVAVPFSIGDFESTVEKKMNSAVDHAAVVQALSALGVGAPS
eukprot:CAMPEP_0174855190 /NCGR_PEP_ID=MMETSP1114-20130205/32678_1 /TAXON_ID=312471 /ORGANISM="Neobodo designis, Strain CCAP 1951/1" /LENGTH=278 /DNA_ID=CAMNT_0016089921 /DNA_START=30 /DNA_END=863 /DNA_ORIENTATION=+